METELSLNLLKEVLENLEEPEKLNNHPWTNKFFVTEACMQNPALLGSSSGKLLVEAITLVFQKLQPVMPPRRGLRLDTRWGVFGLMASQYFVPHRFGNPHPATMREAWQNIDQAILLSVFGQNASVSSQDRQKYQLVGAEMEIGPNSTISDWHRKGMEKLAGALIRYESMLESRAAQNIAFPSPAPENGDHSNHLPKSILTSLKIFAIFGLAVILGVLVWAGIKGWQIAQRVREVENNSIALFALSTSFTDPEQLTETAQMISSMRNDLQALQADTIFIMDLAPSLGWVPKYGGDLAQAPLLLEMGVQLSIAGDEAFQAAAPLIPALMDKGASPHILDLLNSLKDGSSKLLAAQAALSRARSARQRIQADSLTPGLQNLLLKKIDPFLLSMQGAFPVDDLLDMARLAPRLVGAIGNGAQTYLVMVQNEDELRPTGGYLTAIGLLVLENGKISSLTFESSELVNDYSKPYPQAPWQLNRYMMAEMLPLRDANWFTNFPTTVDWVRFLYAYTRPQSIQGVISIDAHVLVELLRQVGPIQIEGITELISDSNVLQYMRSAKEQKPPEGVSTQGWNRKQFINRMASPLIKKLTDGNSQSPQALIKTFIQLLDEKHILILFDDPEMKGLLARHGWDGALRPSQNSDFLMVVDSNVGFNKTNAVVQTAQEYRIDLSDLEKPVAQLTIKHTNNATSSAECIQAGYYQIQTRAEADYRINDCYWSYLRIYTPSGTELVASTPHQIPAPLPLREQEIPARTDTLDEEIPGIQAYGTLLMVPAGKSLQTSFTYRLPPTVISHAPLSPSLTYRLKIQKQPGMLSIPLLIQLKMPPGMIMVRPPAGWNETTDSWTFTTNLQKDINMAVELAPAGK